MEKTVTVCDFCQRDGKDEIASRACCICDQAYCREHACYIDVTLASSSRQELEDNIEVCPDCHALFSFDEGTLDRPIMKMLMPHAVTAIVRALKSIRKDVGSNSIKDWIEHR